MANSLTSYACVKAIRHGKFVEFDFSINDSDLSIELIMPFAAFDEFCKAQKATVTYPDGLSPAALPAGLYRQPDRHDQPNG